MTLPDPDEFAYLAADAAALGVPGPLPPVRRVDLGDGLSALAWGEEPAGLALAHGAALNAHTWDSTLLAWPRPAGFLAVDLPGHGDSAWREDGNYAPDRIAPALGAGLARAVGAGLLAPGHALVGHSLGGLAGLELIRAGEARFRRLLLVDILPLPPDAAATVAAFLDGPASFASREEIVERALAFGFGGGRDALERGVILNTRLTADGRVVWKHHLGVLGGRGLPLVDSASLWPVIDGSPVPIDLVAATASFIDEATLDRFRAGRPDARAVRLTGGHNLQEDAPAELARILAGLLSESEHPA